MTGCLYLSTSSANAAVSPCLTRSIRAASGSDAGSRGHHRCQSTSNTGPATRFRYYCNHGARTFLAAALRLTVTRVQKAALPPASGPPLRTGCPRARRACRRLRCGGFAPTVIWRMQELLKKIEASAAARLPLPPGRQPAQELARYKAFLKVETHRLKLHASGRGPAGWRSATRAPPSWMFCCATCGMQPKPASPTQAQKEFPPLALVAIGGYGRAELNPHSDIDFMFLHGRPGRRRQPAPAASVAHHRRLLYPLWDIGLKVGHSVRSIEDCVKVANSDMQSKTSLIEARLVAGDEALFKTFPEDAASPSASQATRQNTSPCASRTRPPGAPSSATRPACRSPTSRTAAAALRDYPEPALDGVLQIPHPLAQGPAGTRTHQRKRAQATRSRLRLSCCASAPRCTTTSTAPWTCWARTSSPPSPITSATRERSPSKRIEEFMRDVYTHSRNIFLHHPHPGTAAGPAAARRRLAGSSLPGASLPAPRRRTGRHRARGRLQVRRRRNPAATSRGSSATSRGA